MISCVKVGESVINERVKVYTTCGEKKICEKEWILRVISEKILALNACSKWTKCDEAKKASKRVIFNNLVRSIQLNSFFILKTTLVF